MTELLRIFENATRKKRHYHSYKLVNDPEIIRLKFGLEPDELDNILKMNRIRKKKR